jgi:hypothetical protein
MGTGEANLTDSIISPVPFRTLGGKSDWPSGETLPCSGLRDSFPRTMHPLRFPVFFGILLVIAAGGRLGAMGDDIVVVNSTAAPDFNRAIPGETGLRPVNYVFTLGKHFGGSSKDKKEEKTSFEAFATPLAMGLARQNFLPTKDAAAAELMIVVHWGVTQDQEDPNRQQEVEDLNAALNDYNSGVASKGRADPGPMNQALASQESGLPQDQFLPPNAELLGYKRALSKESGGMFPSQAEKTMRLELAEERYFIVLMAYDNKTMKAAKDAKGARLVWVTRVSMPASGKSFAAALPPLIGVGANYFGQQQDTLLRVPVHMRKAPPEAGEPAKQP